MYNVVIIDDEKNCVEVLQILINQYHSLDFCIKASFTNSLEALGYLKENTVDLVFLDIQMPHLSGIDLIASIPLPEFEVVFTTAFDKYAMHAIKLSALDYLLKPIDEDLLKEVIDKFNFKKDKSSTQLQLQNLLQTFNKVGQTAQHKIAISNQEKIFFYNAEEILYCESSGNYTTFYLKNNEKIIASKIIKHYEEILAPYGFIRCHQSYLINSNFITSYNKKEGGSITMCNQVEIPISRNKKDDMLSLFKNS
jgi:two-component system LytT family response regulator